MPISADHLEVFTAWNRGWARTREVAPPVPHADGFRIDVGLPRQVARYVFPQPTTALTQLGETITEPWVFLKANATGDELRALVPPNWQIEPPGFMMTCGDAPFLGTAALPAGYTVHVDDRDAARADAPTCAWTRPMAASPRLAISRWTNAAPSTTASSPSRRTSDAASGAR